MRIWGITSSHLCDKHLIAEHYEAHTLAGAARTGRGAGYARHGLVQFSSLAKRHDEVAAEMTRRGFNHKSPFAEITAHEPDGEIDMERSKRDLFGRCADCRGRIA